MKILFTAFRTLAFMAMYIGALMLLAGFGLAQQSVSILLFTLPAFLVAHLFVIKYEEPTLGKKFDEGYREYCKTVPRWVPRRSR